ncbi:hypothetical protein IB244_17140 [Rhizobium sp. RHZ02]|uniref:hypothetical protein n=1 Tax=Rhizobium sp. RHZ02 TaxID=2769306 RepID=UPI001780DF72|nr:hypothetical protein [Rhizobium sp. RHZ02]MBD9453270.1 hypothetical protein [Rhizobium sp. RHZ02]
MTREAQKLETLTIRLSSDLRERMELVRLGMPYKPTITTIVERGIELALVEIERLAGVCEDTVDEVRAGISPGGESR